MFPGDPDLLEVTPRIQIPCREFAWSAARSSGPGGQNVNKVNSKVTLRWQVLKSPALAADVKQRFTLRYGGRITTDGELVMSSERFRDQSKNALDCLEKLRELLQSVAALPKVRRPVKPTKASKQRRLTEKRERTVTKQRRRPPQHDD